MAKQPNFLTGYGERLTDEVDVPRGGNSQPAPYTFDEAKGRIAPMANSAVAGLNELPPGACPDDYAVGVLTLHPQYTAKSYFPGPLLSAARMQAVSSRSGSVTPEKTRGGRAAVESETVQLFVSARRSDLQEFADQLPQRTEATYGAADLFKVETRSAPVPEERIMRPLTREDEPLLEVVLPPMPSPHPTAFSRRSGLTPRVWG